MSYGGSAAGCSSAEACTARLGSLVPLNKTVLRAPRWLCRGKEAVRADGHRPQRRGGEGSPSGGDGGGSSTVPPRRGRQLQAPLGARELSVG